MVNAKVIKVKETLCVGCDGVVVVSCGCYLSANLAIMAWIPLAESSRVLMKKSLRFGLQWKLFWLKKENLMSDMRLVKQKKQSASACSFQSFKRNLISNVIVKEFCLRICHQAFLVQIANEPVKQKQRMLPLLDLTPSHSR